MYLLFVCLFSPSAIVVLRRNQEEEEEEEEEEDGVLINRLKIKCFMMLVCVVAALAALVV